MEGPLIFVFLLIMLFAYATLGKAGVVLALVGGVILLIGLKQYQFLGTIGFFWLLQHVWRMALREPDIGSELDPREYRIADLYQSSVWRKRRWWMGGALLAHVLLGVAFLVATLRLLSGAIPIEGWWLVKSTWGLTVLALGPATILFLDQYALARDQLRHPRLPEGVERATLQLAHKRGGRLNASELAMVSSLNLEQSAE